MSEGKQAPGAESTPDKLFIALNSEQPNPKTVVSATPPPKPKPK